MAISTSIEGFFSSRGVAALLLAGCLVARVGVVGDAAACLSGSAPAGLRRISSK